MNLIYFILSSFQSKFESWENVFSIKREANVVKYCTDQWIEESVEKRVIPL